MIMDCISNNHQYIIKEKCKGGNVGDFNYGKIIFDETEESIKINKLTYDLYSQTDYEE